MRPPQLTDDAQGRDASDSHRHRACSKLLVVSRNRVHAEALAASLERHLDVTVRTSPYAKALSATDIVRFAPDAILLDTSVLDARTVRRAVANARTICYGVQASAAGGIERPSWRGVSAVVGGDATVEQLASIVAKELRHERMEACVGSRLGTTDTIELGRLTARERQVAHLAMVGLTNREMADTLCISAATVRNHLHRIYAKLGIPGRDAVSGALRAAMRSFGPERPNDHQRPLIAKHGMIGRLP